MLDRMKSSTVISSSSAFNDIDGSSVVIAVVAVRGGQTDFDSFRAFEQRQWGRAGVTKAHVVVAIVESVA